jgi:hypothetical protein
MALCSRKWKTLKITVFWNATPCSLADFRLNMKAVGRPTFQTLADAHHKHGVMHQKTVCLIFSHRSQNLNSDMGSLPLGSNTEVGTPDAAEDSSLSECDAMSMDTIFGVGLHGPEDEGITVVQNVGNYSPNDTAAQPTRPKSSNTHYFQHD